MQVKPLRDYIFVQILDKEYATPGGIVLPHKKDHPKSRRGRVVALGQGIQLKDGSFMPFPSLRLGDIIIFGKYMGVQIEVDGEEFLFLKYDDVICKVTEGDEEEQASSFFLKE